MAKKSDEDIESAASLLLSDIQQDRVRLSEFLDQLLLIDDPVIIAESVARIADSLTKQNVLRINAIKAKIRRASQEDENGTRDVFDQIGLPFQADEEADN